MSGSEPDVEEAGKVVTESQAKRQASVSSKDGAVKPNAIAKHPATITEKQIESKRLIQPRIAPSLSPELFDDSDGGVCPGQRTPVAQGICICWVGHDCG